MTYRQKKLSSIAAKTGIVIGITAAIASLALPTINRASAVGDNANSLPHGSQIGYIGDSLTHGLTYESGAVSYNMPSHSAIAALGGAVRRLVLMERHRRGGVILRV